MRAWLARSRAAAQEAAGDAELWLPGALAWVVSIGWIPFVAVVVPLPREGDLVVFGAGLALAPLWPLNALLLAGVALAALLVALLLLALAESALLRRGDLPAASEADALLRVRLSLSAPTAAALGALALILVAAAPGALQSPDIDGDVYARLVGRALPFVGAAALVLLVGGLLAPGAARRALDGSPRATATAVAGSLATLRRRPLPLAGVALATLVVAVAYLAGVFLLLRVLWAPIGAVLDAGQPIGAGDLLLLLGFVAIWLCLVLGGGALHAWASAWWTLELQTAGGGQPGRSPAAAAEGDRPG